MMIPWTGKHCLPSSCSSILAEWRLIDHDSTRAPSKFQGLNHICFGPDALNYVVLPVIPPKDA